MKKVEFAADVFGSPISIMDTFNNVKLVEKGLINVNKAISELEDKKKDDLTWVDYSQAITPVVLDSVCELLGKTTKADKEKMMGVSYSYIQEFYSKVCKEFTGIELTTVQTLQRDFKRAQELRAGAATPENGEELVDPK